VANRRTLEGQRLVKRITLTRLETGATREVRESVRLYEPEELRQMAAESGLILDAEVGDYLGRAFDHLDIVTTGVDRLRARLEHSDLATALVAEPFTIGDLRRVYGAVWDVELEPANFRRKVLSTPGLVAQTAGTRVVGTGRPADLYVRGAGAVLHPPMPRPG